VSAFLAGSRGTIPFVHRSIVHSSVFIVRCCFYELQTTNCEHLIVELPYPEGPLSLALLGLTCTAVRNTCPEPLLVQGYRHLPVRRYYTKYKPLVQ
jgi:hypothetical protein